VHTVSLLTSNAWPGSAFRDRRSANQPCKPRE